MAGAVGVYTGGGATVLMDPPPAIYARVFHKGSNPDGYLKRQTEQVVILARTIAPRGATLRLRDSIVMNRNRDARGRFAFGYGVSAHTPYAFYVHEGTGPSPRWPQNQKYMKFLGERDYRYVYTDFVWHPGTPAQQFLRDALIALGMG